MYFEQFYLTCLAHASYVLASEGVAAVVDPQRDVDLYLAEAQKNNFKIAHIIETHLHADFISGHQELAARTGAQIHIGYPAGATFPHSPAKEGNEIRFGRCVLRFLETPGHTPEGLCILVTDLDRSPEPWAVLTGDTLFIGDVGRPDLSPQFTPPQLAAMLYDSLHAKLLKLPDSVEVYPAHGAGSLCGRNISSERRSTIGKERQFNFALRPMSRDDFVRMLTAEMPDRPEYFARDAELNRTGAIPLNDLAPLPALAPQEVIRRQAAGAAVLDTRPAAQFGAGHVPGSFHIALSGQYASWAARLIGLDQTIVLVAEDPERLQESRMRLARVGIENVVGYLKEGIQTWEQAGMKLGSVPQIPVHDLHQALQQDAAGLQIVDVRNLAEWNAGHIAQAMLKPLHQLRTSLGDLDPGRATFVHCKSGYRSSIGTSLLRRAGFRNVINVVGGFDAWHAQNLPEVSSTAPARAG